MQRKHKQDIFVYASLFINPHRQCSAFYYVYMQDSIFILFAIMLDNIMRNAWWADTVKNGQPCFPLTQTTSNEESLKNRMRGQRINTLPEFLSFFEVDLKRCPSRACATTRAHATRTQRCCASWVLLCMSGLAQHKNWHLTSVPPSYLFISTFL